MGKGVVYILRSLGSNRFYIGSTDNLKRRLVQHESGVVKSTHCLLPLRLELAQEYDNISIARKIERKLKSLKRKDYIEKIVKSGFIKMGP